MFFDMLLAASAALLTIAAGAAVVRLGSAK